MAAGCCFTANPVGYPNGTPIGCFSAARFGGREGPGLARLWCLAGRCGKHGRTAALIDNFQLPKGFAPFMRVIIGNIPPVVAYRPGIGFCNLVPQKFNPSNPNLTFTRNYNTGAIIIAAFGTIQ